MTGLKRIEGYGEAVLYRGDPRLPTGDIDSWMQDMLFEHKSVKARPHLWGADAGLCARRNVLLQHNTAVATTVTPESNAYMSIGVALEDMLAKGLNENGRLLIQGMYLPLMPEVKIRGKIDLIIFDHEDKLALVEVKTCGKLPNEPRPTHLAQIQTYAAVSGITRCWLTYISRNVQGEEWGKGLAIRTFQVETGKDALRSRLATALLSQEAGEAAALPPVPAHFRKHTECHYCEFRDFYCWKPRPGLGGERDFPPLPEMGVEALANAMLKAGLGAEALLQAAPWRTREMLHQLLDGPLSEANRGLVSQELVQVEAELAGEAAPT